MKRNTQLSCKHRLNVKILFFECHLESGDEGESWIGYADDQGEATAEMLQRAASIERQECARADENFGNI